MSSSAPKKYTGLPSKEKFIVSKLNSPSIHSSQRSAFGSIRSTRSTLRLSSSLSPALPSKRVLEESEYLNELSGIIKRDYYPDLPQDTTMRSDPHLNLSNFGTQYISSDNESFHRLLQKLNEKRKSRLRLVQATQLRPLAQGKVQDMAHLLLPPSQPQLGSQASVHAPAKGKRQTVRRENTRLPLLQFVDSNTHKPLSLDGGESQLAFVDESIEEEGQSR